MNLNNYLLADPAIKETAGAWNPSKEALRVVAVPGADVTFVFRGAAAETGAIGTGRLAKENGANAQKDFVPNARQRRENKKPRRKLAVRGKQEEIGNAPESYSRYANGEY